MLQRRLSTTASVDQILQELADIQSIIETDSPLQQQIEAEKEKALARKKSASSIQVMEMTTYGTTHPSTVVPLQPDCDALASRPSIDLTASLQEDNSPAKPVEKSFWMKLFNSICPCLEDDKTDEFIHTSEKSWGLK